MDIPTKLDPTWTATVKSKTTAASSPNTLPTDEPLVGVGSPIDVCGIRSKNREGFLALLKKYGSPKYLSLDPALVGPLGLLIDAPELKRHGVEGWTECGANFLSPDVPRNVIFLCRPNVVLMQYIVDQISTLETQTERLPLKRFGVGNTLLSASGIPFVSEEPSPVALRKYCIVFVPSISEACMLVLRRSPILSRHKVTVTALPIYFFPLEVDVLSMELQSTFLNAHGHNDPNNLMYASEAIIQLQQHLGKPIPQIRAIGSAAQYVSESLIRQRKETMVKLASSEHAGGAMKYRKYFGGAAGEGVAKSSDSQVPPVSFLLNTDRSEENAAVELQDIMTSFRKSLSSVPEEFDGGDPIVYASIDERESLIQAAAPDTVEYDFEFLILIDRRTDLYTPLCSPFTYEALLDTIHGISCTHLELSQDSSPLNLTSSDAVFSSDNFQKTRLDLNSNDKLFASLRDLHQSKLGTFLHMKATEIQEIYKEKDNLTNITEITQYMKKFKVAQSERSSLSTHVELASQISKITKGEDYHSRLQLEDEIVQSSGSGASNEIVASLLNMIEQGQPLREVYRLICLTSLVNNGFRTNVLNSLKSSIIQQYGFEEFLRFSLLQKVGLLCSSQGKSQWDTIKKKFNLLIGEQESLKDIAYVFSGYAPLSTRLVQLLFSLPMGWRSCSEDLNLLWGPAMEIKQQNFPVSTTTTKRKSIEQPLDSQSLSNTSNVQKVLPKPQSCALIFFLGGVTYAEITAIRKLSEIEKGARQYIIATTELLNAAKLFSSFLDVKAIKKVN